MAHLSNGRSVLLHLAFATAGAVLASCSGGGGGGAPIPRQTAAPVGTPIGTQAATVSLTSAHGYTLSVSLQNVSSTLNINATGVSIAAGAGPVAASALPAPAFSSAAYLDAIPVTFGCASCAAGVWPYVAVQFVAATSPSGSLVDPWIELVSLAPPPVGDGIPAGTTYVLTYEPVAIVPPGEPDVWAPIVPGQQYAFMIASWQ